MNNLKMDMFLVALIIVGFIVYVIIWSPEVTVDDKDKYLVSDIIE